MIEVVGSHARVDEVLSRSDGYYFGYDAAAFSHKAPTRPLCQRSPCVVDLPLGSHELRFESDADWRTDTEFVVAGANPSAVRYAPGVSKPRRAVQVLGGVGLGVGLPALLIGGLVLGLQKPDATDDQRNGALIFTAASAGLVALSALLLILVPPEYQPGRSIQWELRRDEAGR